MAEEPGGTCGQVRVWGQRAAAWDLKKLAVGMLGMGLVPGAAELSQRAVGCLGTLALA